MSSEAPPRTLPPAPSLREALRRARAESAERSGVLVELRTAELGRLDLLKEALVPVLAQVPDEIDLFETALLPGDPARLFIDALGFVEMGQDKRTYRFFQDTRYGRRLIAEGDRLGSIVEAITDYVARRMVEREQALASDDSVFVPRQNVAPETVVAPPAEASAPSQRGSLALLFVVVLILAFAAIFALRELWFARLG